MSWKSIVGHEPVVRLLKGQLTRDRLAHAYLFTGQRGIGKQTIALEFAKALECESPRSGESCDSCEHCRGIGQGSFPDLMIVRPDSESGSMGIDQVRLLSNWLALTPYQGRWKISIVEEADRFTEEAAHACLRLLEEPSDRSVLILIASAIHRLPATLISRCHRVHFAPQGIQKVALFLEKEQQLDPGLAMILATCSGGRLGVALEFHREQRLGEKNAVLDQLLTAFGRKAPEVPLGTAARAEIEEALEWLAAWWRDLLLLSLKGEPSWLIHQDRLPELQAAAVSAPAEELLERLEWTYWVQEAIQRNASPRIALSTLLCR